MAEVEAFRILEVEMPEGGIRLASSDDGWMSTSLVLGPNGAGKSMLLGDIAYAFGLIATSDVWPPADRQGPRRLRRLKYAVGNHLFTARFERGILVATTADGSPCDPGRLPLPTCVIASTISPFDRFPRVMTRPVGDDDTVPFTYSYLGPRGPGSSAGATSLVGNVVDILGSPPPHGGWRRSDLGQVFGFLGLGPDLAVVYRAARPSSRLWRTSGREAIAGELGRLAEGFDRFAPLRQVHSTPMLDEVIDAIAVVGPLIRASAGLRLRATIEVGAIGSPNDLLLHAARILRSFGLLECVGAEATRLNRPDAPFDLAQASSGELAILVTFLGVAVALRDGGLVLVDEPELSLHPAWQAAWLKLLLDTFSDYRGCHFVAATHSPLIVGDAHARRASVVSLDRRHAPVHLDRALDSGSADAALVNAFGVASDGNYYVRDLLARALRLAYGGHLAGNESTLLLEELTGVRSLLTQDSPLGRAIDVLMEARSRLGSDG